MDPLPQGTTPSGPDTTTATEFLNDLMLATSGLMQEQLARWSSALQQMRQGQYDARQLQMDVARLWDPWVALATFPFQWWSNYSQPLPLVLLVVDGVAEATGPVRTRLNRSLPPGVTLEVSDLHQLGGNKTLSASSHLKVELTPDGGQLLVQLVDLGSGGPARAAKGIQSGFYVGVVYAVEGAATRRPLALVHVFLEQP